MRSGGSRLIKEVLVMARRGKAGVGVKHRGDWVQLAFWGYKNGQSRRLTTTKLHRPTREVVNAEVETTIERLRSEYGS